MLIHITPKIYRPQEALFVGKCTLKQVTIPELNLVLIEGEHIKTGTPWPNKNHFCGSPKSSRKHLFGLLIETPEHISELTVTCQWGLDYWSGETVQTVEHTTKIVVLDDEHDAISTDVIYWHQMSEELGDWESRIPKNIPDAAPLFINPCLWLIHNESQVGVLESERCNKGLITRCVQKLEVPTIQKERFRIEDRFPTFETTFKVNK